MITTKVAVTGMRCPNCEKHVNEAVKKNFKIRSVASDHEKNETIIVSKEALDGEKLMAVIREEGFVPGEITVIEE